jgi:hypothetical protein
MKSEHTKQKRRKDQGKMTQLSLLSTPDHIRQNPKVSPKVPTQTHSRVNLLSCHTHNSLSAALHCYNASKTSLLKNQTLLNVKRWLVNARGHKSDLLCPSQNPANGLQQVHQHTSRVHPAILHSRLLNRKSREPYTHPWDACQQAQPSSPSH